jgi:hypothetical protein
MHRRYDFFRSWPLAHILASAAPMAHGALEYHYQSGL